MGNEKARLKKKKDPVFIQLLFVPQMSFYFRIIFAHGLPRLFVHSFSLSLSYSCVTKSKKKMLMSSPLFKKKMYFFFNPFLVCNNQSDDAILKRIWAIRILVWGNTHDHRFSSHYA